MSVDGKISFVFSGDDDTDVIIPLPLAFLRLITSGIYTYDINWYDDSWQIAGVDSNQLAIIEGALSRVSDAIDTGGLSMSSITKLPSTTYVYNQSGTNSNPPQIAVLKADFPAIADAEMLLCSVKTTLELERQLTAFRYGGATNQQMQMVPAGGNKWTQFLIPVDATGFKINVSGSGTLAYWTIAIGVNAYW